MSSVYIIEIKSYYVSFNYDIIIDSIELIGIADSVTR